jgi:hypothetical protein
MESRVSRRTFLRCASAASLVTMSILKGDAGEAASGRPTAHVPPGGKYREAPMLAARVAAGKLPPVEKRLPAVPFVRNVAQIGRYGGTLYDQAESPGGAVPPGRNAHCGRAGDYAHDQDTNAAGCPYYTRCPYRQEICAHQEPALRTIAPGHTVACHFDLQLQGT